MMAVPKKEDERVAARVANEEEEGSGSGYFNQFLHDWAASVSAAYRAPPDEDGCTLVVDVVYLNDHLIQFEPVHPCSAAAEEAFVDAIHTAPRPPMPSSWGGQQKVIRFFDTGRRH